MAKLIPRPVNRVRGEAPRLAKVQRQVGRYDVERLIELNEVPPPAPPVQQDKPAEPGQVRRRRKLRTPEQQIADLERQIAALRQQQSSRLSWQVAEAAAKKTVELRSAVRTLTMLRFSYNTAARAKRKDLAEALRASFTTLHSFLAEQGHPLRPLED